MRRAPDAPQERRLTRHSRLLLLQRPETDVQLKDYEGYTAFDLYNSTVEGTSPERDVPGDVYTWGTNRYAKQAQR